MPWIHLHRLKDIAPAFIPFPSRFTNWFLSCRQFPLAHKLAVVASFLKKKKIKKQQTNQETNKTKNKTFHLTNLSPNFSLKLNSSKMFIHSASISLLFLKPIPIRFLSPILQQNSFSQSLITHIFSDLWIFFPVLICHHNIQRLFTKQLQNVLILQNIICSQLNSKSYCFILQ